MIWRVRGHIRRHDILGNVAVSRREIPSIFSDNALDCGDMSQLLDLAAAHPGISVPTGRLRQRDLHDAVGAHIGKRIDQDGIDHAEDRAGGADPERQREYRGQSEAWPSAEFTPRVAEVRHQRVHSALDGESVEGVGSVGLL